MTKPEVMVDLVKSCAVLFASSSGQHREENALKMLKTLVNISRTGRRGSFCVALCDVLEKSIFFPFVFTSTKK